MTSSRLPGIGRRHLIHEGEELDAAAALLVSGLHLAGSYLERREKGGGAVPLVVVALAGERAAIGKLQIALFALQGLDRGLLVHAQHDGVLGRRQVEPDDVRGLGGKLGIVTFAPGLARSQIDLVGAQKAPDVLHVHVAERLGDQRRRPARMARRRRLVELPLRMRRPVASVYLATVDPVPRSSRPASRFSA